MNWEKSVGGWGFRTWPPEIPNPIFSQWGQLKVNSPFPLNSPQTPPQNDRSQADVPALAGSMLAKLWFGRLIVHLCHWGEIRFWLSLLRELGWNFLSDLAGLGAGSGSSFLDWFFRIHEIFPNFYETWTIYPIFYGEFKIEAILQQYAILAEI